jgi:hypothetical protein
MFLETRDGIKCDICGSVHRERFTYYSVDQTPHERVAMAVASGHAESFDICESCFDSMKEECKKNLGTVQRGSIKCDSCPKYMQGEFKYYRAIIAKVVVDRDQKEEGPLDVEYRCMDFNFCDDCGSLLLNKVKETRKSHSDKGGWS